MWGHFCALLENYCQNLQYSFVYGVQDITSTSTFLRAADVARELNQTRRSDGSGFQSPLAIHVQQRDNDEVVFGCAGPAEPHHQRVPDIHDRETVINLAKMTSDAYVLAPSDPGWQNISLGYNDSSGFGWEGNGLRGRIFANEGNHTVIIAFKGTSIDPRSSWTVSDRLNDNLLFSCCCGAQQPNPYFYSPVCDCRTTLYECNSTCLTQELSQNGTYYAAALNVMRKIYAMYPNSDIWSIGHSLGGAVASLIGLTYGLPIVTFEAPPERLAAQRLNLATSPQTFSYHFGNTADPVYMGACNGWSSSCAIAGYDFESQCFTGKRCVYDTINDQGWHLSMLNHRINAVITDVLENYNSTPICDFDDDCVDCFNWKFV